MDPEKDVIEGLKNGDRKALASVFNLYHKSLCYFVKQVVNDNEQAEEIVADAFIKLWQKNTDFNQLAEIKLFLFMIVRSSCANARQYLYKSDKQIPELLSQTENYVDSKMIKAGILQIFLEEIEKLPPIRQKIFKMSFLEDLSIFEIAEKLQVTIDTVRVQKAKALHSICSVMIEKKL